MPNVRGQREPMRAFANMIAGVMQSGNQLANFKDFKAVGPPEFRGSRDPMEAQIWIEEIEKVFEVTRVAEEQKTTFATFMLKGEANYWWKINKNREGGGSVTWTRFKELFFENYFSENMQEQMEVIFLELKQGNMTVIEYAAKFNELARFAPHQVDTEARKARRFEQGLEPWIFSRVAVLRIQTFSSLLERAIIVEGGNGALIKFNPEQEENQKEGRIKNKSSEGSNSNKRKRISKFGMGDKSRETKNEIKMCGNCGRSHQGVCLKGSNSCYRCGQEGHVASNCSIPKRSKECFACGSANHQVKDCPTKRNKRGINNKSNNSRLSIGKFVHPSRMTT